MNLKEIWERIGVRPWRVVALLIGFVVVVFVVVPLARPLLGLPVMQRRKLY
jgi:hypothetical protein